jgi:hypothetical protein
MALKQGRNWGYWGQNAVKVVKFIKMVFSVVIIGLYDPKTGSKLGLSGPKWDIIGLYGSKTGPKLELLGPKRCQSCQSHQNGVFSVVIIGLYDPKTGSKLGLPGPKWGHNWVVTP